MNRRMTVAGLLLTTVALSLGCNQAGAPSSTTKRTTTTTTTETGPATGPNGPSQNGPSQGVRVDAGPNGATATGQTARGDGVDVNVDPNGKVGVDVQGEPIRDRLRQRRAAREENLPR